MEIGALNALVKATQFVGMALSGAPWAVWLGNSRRIGTG